MSIRIAETRPAALDMFLFSAGVFTSFPRWDTEVLYSGDAAYYLSGTVRRLNTYQSIRLKHSLRIHPEWNSRAAPEFFLSVWWAQKADLTTDDTELKNGPN
jgi:hypothetical protein